MLGHIKQNFGIQNYYLQYTGNLVKLFGVESRNKQKLLFTGIKCTPKLTLTLRL